MAQMITTKYGVYMPKVEAWTIGKIDREMGYRSMPVVTVYKADGTHDEWCDLRVDKIKQYTEG